jgi:hypothetical protein
VKVQIRECVVHSTQLEYKKGATNNLQLHTYTLVKANTKSIWSKHESFRTWLDARICLDQAIGMQLPELSAWSCSCKSPPPA